ncbi:MAG: hypothetical protein LQ342_005233 [Letrouitia transgressa]|nr:MAG: hypothetical protein LQ342_005233 [Letrouitia transgressa]
MFSNTYEKLFLNAQYIFHLILDGGRNAVSLNSLPTKTLFPGPWEENIKAPIVKSAIYPIKVWNTEGEASKPEALLEWADKGTSTQLGSGGLISLEFSENIAGRVCFDIQSFSSSQSYLALAYSESPNFVGRLPDATTDRQERDLPLYLGINGTGTNCVGPDFVRGAFKYLTVYIPEADSDHDGFWSDEKPSGQVPLVDHFQGHGSKQKHLGLHKEHETLSVSITSVWVNCTAFPSNPNPRAYTGYFDSSSTVLNRIWYAGAYTLQITTIDPREGSALIDYNRRLDNNESPPGSWYSNFTIANGSAITTDGAKRDRMAYPGDMAIAVPGIAVSTFDMVAVRTALDSIFIRQYEDGSLPYAGPPMGYTNEFSDTYHMHSLLGVYNYILYTDDLPWLRDHWGAYLKAFEVCLAKVDLTGLYHVTSRHDWLRPGMTGHNLEATSIMYYVINLTVRLTDILGDPYAKAQVPRWESIAARMRRGVEILYCPESGLYGDNVGRRGCGGSEECHPQDGNSWALVSGLVTSPERRTTVSQSLRSRWLKFGAPATEFPNVISPFASSFELLAHSVAGNDDAAVELMKLMWGYMLDGPGFTNSTLVEGYRVDGDIQYPAYWSRARNSHAHGWSTGPTMALLTKILGIELVTPIGKTWRIEPGLTKWLRRARGGYATLLGKFEVIMRRMRFQDGGIVEVVDLETPRRSEGTVVLGIEWNVKGGKHRFTRELKDDGEGTWEKVAPGWREEEMVEDENWVEPEMEEREAGVVDWEIMPKLYVGVGLVE